MHFPRWLPALVAALGLAACSNVPSGGLRVELTKGSGSTAICARVVVRSANAIEESDPLLLGAKMPLLVGVRQNAMPATVTVQAFGYSDAACTALSVPAEQSEEVEAKFATPVGVVALTLELGSNGDGGVVTADGGPDDAGTGDAGTGDGGTDGGVVTDVDNDGSPLPFDCNDSDPTVRPGIPEVCTDGKDNDCDTLDDCQDPGCAGLGCGVGGVCTNLVCVAATEVNLCMDNVDNDLDGKTDCDDPDCPAGTLCSDKDSCTLDDTCQSPDAGCVKAMDKLCLQPPNTKCFAPMGVCALDGGVCGYTQLTGGCDDGLKCTLGDTCIVDDGSCVGAAVTCPATTNACLGAGACSESLDGGCFYPPKSSATGCDDGNNCTISDTCDGDGGCKGTQAACAVPGQCFAPSGTCNADGGCILTVRLNLPCDAGTCGADGGCQSAIFPYNPTNFTEADLPTAAGALTFGCGATLMNTQGPDGGVGWTNLCGAVPAVKLVPVGGQMAVLIFADSLFLDAGSSLRAVGPRPLIFAVRTSAIVSGTLDVGSQKLSRGAGGSINCNPAPGGAGSDGGVSGTLLSGGGGGGAAFGTDGTNGSNAETGAPGGAKGVTFGNATLDPLRGGCRGGHGGRFDAVWGLGGLGGGAIQISAAAALTVTPSGTVTAYGAGGKGGEADARTGGGGAGSGGGILIEADNIFVNGLGAVTANGGGGGEGSGYNGAQYFGADGADGPMRLLTGALGGVSVACGGNGGNGASRLAGATAAGPPGCSQSIPGGGGGGGVGRIRFNAASSCTLNAASVISPQATGNRAGCM